MSNWMTSFAATRVARTPFVALPISFLTVIACESRKTCGRKRHSPAHASDVHDDSKGSLDIDDETEAVMEGIVRQQRPPASPPETSDECRSSLEVIACFWISCLLMY